MVATERGGPQRAVAGPVPQEGKTLDGQDFRGSLHAAGMGNVAMTASPLAPDAGHKPVATQTASEPAANGLVDLKRNMQKRAAPEARGAAVHKATLGSGGAQPAQAATIARTTEKKSAKESSTRAVGPGAVQVAASMPLTEVPGPDVVPASSPDGMVANATEAVPVGSDVVTGSPKVAPGAEQASQAKDTVAEAGTASEGTPAVAHGLRAVKGAGVKAAADTGEVKKGSALKMEQPALAVAAPDQGAARAKGDHGDRPGSAVPLLEPTSAPGVPVMATVPHAAMAELKSTPAARFEAQLPVAVDLPPASSQQPGDTRTLAATPQVLEVGIASGTHGWLRVRAELGSGGEVSASVLAPSMASAQALRHELPALQEYLTREQVGVGSVIVSSAPDSRSTATAGGGRQHSQQHSQQQAGEQSARTPGSVEPWKRVEAGGMFGLLDKSSLAGHGGGWVNVRV